MRILPITTSNTYFKGVKPPYTNPKGYYVRPLEKDPKQSDIQAAVEMANMRKGTKATNVTIYRWGDDMVIKKYEDRGEDIKYEPDREADALDKIQEDGINYEHNQHGKYAFVTPNGVHYLVATRVKGETIEMNPNAIRQYSLQDMYNGIELLDKGVTKTDIDKKTGMKKFDIKRAMHYHLTADNASFVDYQGGISGFHRLKYIDLTSYMEKINELENPKSVNPNLSDVGLLPSNMRSFEHRGLYDAFTKAKNPRKVLRNHFYAKSDYSCKMFIWMRDIAEQAEGKQKEQFTDIALGYAAQSNILAQAYDNEEAFPGIEEAEARKIQISRWLYEMSDSCPDAKINYNQVKEYVNATKEFFIAKEEEAVNDNNEQRIKYYKDCIKLINAWQGGVNFYIDNGLKDPQERNLKENEKAHANTHHQLMMKKSTDEQITTLDEIIKKY